MAEAIAPATEVTPVVSTEENALEVPQFAEPAKEKAAEEATAPVTKVEETVDDNATLKKRLTGAISEVEKKNDEVRRAVDLQAELVSSTPDIIHKIAATDPVMANKVIEKVWGLQGIRSYKQLMEQAKLEEIKETDPDLYETRKEMAEVKARLKDRDEREQKTMRAEFLASKGIIENEYDPNFIKFQEAAEAVNPKLLEEDYKKALASQYAIAFAESKMVPHKAAPPTVSVGGGTPPAPLPAERPPISDQSAWLAESLNKMRGYKISLNT